MQGGVIINREGFAYRKDLSILNARLSALEAEVASLRINQHTHAGYAQISNRDCNAEMVGGSDADILGEDYEVGNK